MIIKMIEGCTRILGKSQGYLGLPLRDEVISDSVTGPQTPCMVTAWEPTPQELESLNNGAPILLRIIGNMHPPVMVDVGQPVMVCSGCGSHWSDEELNAQRAANPRIISCCPERRMVLEKHAANAEKAVAIAYTNWRGETSVRTIVPLSIWFGSTDWHPEPQWLLKAIDMEKGAERDFALKDFGKRAPAADTGQAVNVEAIAKVISLSYGENPEDDAPLGKICGPNNEPLPNWEAYREQAAAVFVWMMAVIDALEKPAPSADTGQAVAWPRLTSAMIEAACRAHFGTDNVDGVDLTANDVNWSFRDAFKRMWKGAKSAYRAPASLAADTGQAVAWRKEHDALGELIRLLDDEPSIGDAEMADALEVARCAWDHSRCPAHPAPLDAERVSELEALLKPFALEADQWADIVPDDHRSLCTEPGSETAHPGSETTFTVGDLRRARAALRQKEGEA